RICRRRARGTLQKLRRWTARVGTRSSVFQCLCDDAICWQAPPSSSWRALPWEANAGDPPQVVKPGPWHFFNGDEGRAVEAIADRIIPPDPATPGGKDAGCAVYLDRQLAGPYGHNAGHYNRPPFMAAAKNFGPQSESNIAKTYRDGLAALDRYCTANKGGKHFAELSDND